MGPHLRMPLVLSLVATLFAAAASAAESNSSYIDLSTQCETPGDSQDLEERFELGRTSHGSVRIDIDTQRQRPCPHQSGSRDADERIF